MAEDSIEYRIETTYASEEYPDSEYQGWPDAHKDRLWSKYEGEQIIPTISHLRLDCPRRLTATQKEGNYLWIDGQTASKLPFETEHAPTVEHMDDYVVGLSVFHVLHCLSVLRRNIYPRHYNSSLIKPDGTVDWNRWHHVDHCLETVRRDILCHADTSATTWEWIEASQMTIRPETKHVCRNFDKISQWAYDRHVQGNQRTHVEGGKIVDYTGQPPSEAWDKIQVLPPADWAYREEDL